jgi:hypothetical protein
MSLLRPLGFVSIAVGRSRRGGGGAHGSVRRVASSSLPTRRLDGGQKNCGPAGSVPAPGASNRYPVSGAWTPASVQWRARMPGTTTRRQRSGGVLGRPYVGRAMSARDRSRTVAGGTLCTAPKNARGVHRSVEVPWFVSDCSTRTFDGSTTSPPSDIGRCWLNRVVSAPSAEPRLQPAGAPTSTSITATTPESFAACFATTATLVSDISRTTPSSCAGRPTTWRRLCCDRRGGRVGAT